MKKLGLLLVYTTLALAADDVSFPERLQKWEKSAFDKLRSHFVGNMQWRTRQIEKDAKSLAAELELLKAKDFPYDAAAYRRYIEDEFRKRRQYLEEFPSLLHEAFNSSAMGLEVGVERFLSDANRSPKKGSDIDLPDPAWRKLELLDLAWTKEERRRQEYVSPTTYKKPEQPPYDQINIIDKKPIYITVSVEGRIENPKVMEKIFEECGRIVHKQEDSSLLRYDDEGTLFYKDSKVVYKFFFKDEEPKEEKKDVKKEPTYTEITDKKMLDDLNGRYRHRVLLLIHSKKIARVQEMLAPFKDEKKVAAIPSAIYRESLPEKPANDELVVFDIFERPLTKLPLIDWEGYVANPAFRFTLRAPKGMRAPVLVELTTENTRLYFDLPSKTDAKGSRKVVVLEEGKNGYVEGSFLMSIWPDRDGEDEKHQISALYWEAPAAPRSPLTATHLPGAKKTFFTVEVQDQDSKKGATDTSSLTVERPSSYPYSTPAIDRPLESSYPFRPTGKVRELAQPSLFNITLDFTEDDSKFFSGGNDDSSMRQKIVERARDDWADFLADQGNSKVSIGEETTPVKEDGTAEAKLRNVKNKYAYKDFLLYVTATSALDTRTAQSQAEGSGFHQDRSGPTGLKRSGHTLLEGIGNKIGFSYSIKDDDWWKAQYSPYEPHDLYSAFIHEIGHALFAHTNYKPWERWTESGKIDDIYVQAYHHALPLVGKDSHFVKGQIDFASKKGAYGTVSGTVMPQLKWILTKLDILLLKTMGYKLRELAFLKPLRLDLATLPDARLGKAYASQMKASGGTPSYFWNVVAGSLPPGLALNSYTGEVTGTPKEGGSYFFLIQLRDQSDETQAGFFRSHRIIVD